MGMKARCSCRETIAAFTLEVYHPILQSGATVMSKVTVYVGLDDHRDSIPVCVMDAKRPVTVPG